MSSACGLYVGKLIRLRPERPRNPVRFSAGKMCCVLQRIRTVPGAHRASYSVSTIVFFHRAYSDQVVKLTPSNAEIKNMWRYASTTSNAFTANTGTALTTGLYETGPPQEQRQIRIRLQVQDKVGDVMYEIYVFIAVNFKNTVFCFIYISNVCKLLPVCVALHPTRQQYSKSYVHQQLTRNIADILPQTFYFLTAASL